jgi:hypothetical protein
MDIVVWLRSLGLGRYEATFRENEIDETVLPSLTHETLKELGVTAVGHRLIVRGAIRVLVEESKRGAKMRLCLIKGIHAQAFAACHREISEGFLGPVSLAVVMGQDLGHLGN